MPANGRVASRKCNDRVVGLDVAADELVGLRNTNEFLHARHFVESARLDHAGIAGDANGSALLPRHGVRTIAERLDLLADGPDLLVRGLGLHHD